MLPGKSLAGAEHSRGIARSQRFFPAVASSARAFRIACAVILICAGATPALRTQTSSAQTTDPCPDDHLKPTLDCSKRNPPDNNEDGTKVALACEWVNTDNDGVTHALEALKLLTCSTQDVDVRKSDTCRALNRTSEQDRKVAWYVLKELKEGAPVSDYPFYQWALGDPDTEGKPKGAAMATFPEALAKANTLTTGAKKKSTDEEGLFKDELFECTKNLIDKIYRDGGPIVLARIHDTFVKNKLNLALIQLLDAEIKADHNVPTVYSQNLEKFRAAFEKDNKRLAGQVADKINSTQQ